MYITPASHPWLQSTTLYLSMEVSWMEIYAWIVELYFPFLFNNIHSYIGSVNSHILQVDIFPLFNIMVKCPPFQLYSLDKMMEFQPICKARKEKKRKKKKGKCGWAKKQPKFWKFKFIFSHVYVYGATLLAQSWMALVLLPIYGRQYGRSLV